MGAAVRPALQLAALAALLLLPARVVAQAGPPYETDDPDPGAYHHWEFYLGTEDARTPGATSGTAPHVEVNYAAGRNLFLHGLVPLAYATAPGSSPVYGLGDVEVGTKWRLVQDVAEKRLPGSRAAA